MTVLAKAKYRTMRRLRDITGRRITGRFRTQGSMPSGEIMSRTKTGTEYNTSTVKRTIRWVALIVVRLPTAMQSIRMCRDSPDIAPLAAPDNA
jgi:hypothetical protein